MAGKINITNSTFGVIKDNICSDGVYIDGVKVSDDKHQGKWNSEKYRLTVKNEEQEYSNLNSKLAGEAKDLTKK